jgi:iron complex outermembrane receptor protein
VLGSLGTFVLDVASVRAKGFELEVTAAPTRGLTLGAGLGYTDTTFPYITPLWLQLNNQEYIPTNRPKWTGNIYGSYETQPLFGETTLLLRMDGIFRSSYFQTSKPKQDALSGPLVNVTNGITALADFKLNARIALRHIQIGAVEAELAVWGKNLTNRKDAISNINFGFLAASNYEPARTFGVDLGVTF